MEKHCQNAHKVAGFLKNHPKVTAVNFAGLEGDRSYELVQRYCDGNPASLMTFEIEGGFEKAVKFYDALKLFKRLVNIGDAKSLACHPASTTHRQMSEQEQSNAGVTPGMIRLCVGIEHEEDIIADLSEALDNA